MNDEAVLDLETGLVWARSPRETKIYRANEEECMAIGGRLGWRLPSVEEILTLIDPSKPFGQPRLPSSHPFVLTGSGEYKFWTSTPVFGTSDYFIVIRIDQTNGNMDLNTPEGDLAAGGWCVRGPTGSNSPRRYN
jgi:hypothetical protein